MTDERTIDDIKEDLKLAKAEMSPQEFVEEPVEEVVDEPSEEVEEVDEVEDSHGHITYEDWVSQGKDPDMWKGKKAFDAEYDRIQENKSLKSDVKDMKAAIDALTATFEDERERAVKEAYDKAEKDWQSKLIEATEVGDTEVGGDHDRIFGRRLVDLVQAGRDLDRLLRVGIDVLAQHK